MNRQDKFFKDLREACDGLGMVVYLVNTTLDKGETIKQLNMVKRRINSMLETVTTKESDGVDG